MNQTGTGLDQPREGWPEGEGGWEPPLCRWLMRGSSWDRTSWCVSGRVGSTECEAMTQSPLLPRNLTYTETLRRNKSEIPPQFLPSSSTEEASSVYGFTNDLTLVSLCS
ncbi:hypothetical protein PR048_031973 [Dryococelus australis]|uniref:Uncharacterized protein n=1 Tax=Dryococelus australis TaxID=614101 RepID=A0ABQ9G6U2_9NEOP|nr:hypothetical protein PR048_031973 [Dryococelus australis]